MDKIFIFAPSTLMTASIMAYPQYGACRYYFDGQIMRLMVKKRRVLT